jgi:hypothetical protein
MLPLRAPDRCRMDGMDETDHMDATQAQRQRTPAQKGRDIPAQADGLSATPALHKTDAKRNMTGTQAQRQRTPAPKGRDIPAQANGLGTAPALLP